ncbi:MAG: alkaline phosphatase family protein [Verrucomicrobiota bacterium]
MKKRRVLLIGWDSADWRLLRPLMERGLMPNLSRLTDSGAHGNLASLDPLLSPIIWTSIATGKFPHKHGVLGFVEPDPAGSGIRPVGSATRTTAALWNMLSESGLKTHVVGWFAGHPAESVSGVCVSERFSLPSAPGPAAPWPAAEGTVNPADLMDALLPLRVHPREIEGGQLLPFVPGAAALDQSDPEVAGKLEELARVLAETATHQAAATFLMENHDWDFLGVYFRALDTLGHHFMPFHPPLMPGIDPAAAETWGRVMETACIFHDLMLGRMMALAGPDTTVIVLSDHGFESAASRPGTVANETQTMAEWHRPFGIIAMSGPGICPGEQIYGSSVLDIAPTILHLFGLPCGRDMDGKVLMSALENPAPVERIPTWDINFTPMGKAEDESSRAVIQQLIALGYMDENAGTDAARASLEIGLNRITSLLQTAEFPAAEAEARALSEKYPEEPRCRFKLVQTLLWLGRVEEARGVLDQTEADLGITLTSRRIRSNIRLMEGTPEEALKELRTASPDIASGPDLQIQFGRIHLRRRSWPEAETAFRAALAVEPDLPSAWCGLAAALVRQDRDEAALQAVLTALGLQHFYPLGHFQLGAILSKMARFGQAVQAFETGLSMEAGHPMAHRYLSRLHRRLGNLPASLAHGEYLRRLRQPSAALL